MCGSSESERIVHHAILFAGKGKGKAVAVHAWADPKDSRRLRLTDVKTIGT